MLRFMAVVLELNSVVASCLNTEGTEAYSDRGWSSIPSLARQSVYLASGTGCCRSAKEPIAGGGLTISAAM